MILFATLNDLSGVGIFLAPGCDKSGFSLPNDEYCQFIENKYGQITQCHGTCFVWLLFVCLLFEILMCLVQILKCRWMYIRRNANAWMKKKILPLVLSVMSMHTQWGFPVILRRMSAMNERTANQWTEQSELIKFLSLLSRHKRILTTMSTKK